MTIPFTYLIGWSQYDLWYYGEENGMYGKQHSEATRDKIREKAKNRKMIECTCGKIATPQTLGRFHKNCKSTAELQKMLDDLRNSKK